MELTRTDRTYGMVIGSAIADAYGSAAKRTLAEQRLVSPVDPPIPPSSVGRWGEATQLLLFYLDYFTQLNQDAVDYITRALTRQEPDTLALYCVGAAALCHSTDYQLLLCTVAGHARLFGSDTVLAKLWAAVIDGAYHGAPKEALVMRATYANIHEIDRFTTEFDELASMDADTVAYINADKSPLAAVFTALRVFRRTVSYVEATRVAVNNTMAPQLVGILVGQLAGCYYGISDIPERWVAAVQGKAHLRDTIRSLPYNVQRVTVLPGKLTEGHVDV